MANFIPIGAVIDPSKDRFATTGPHTDIRVIPQFGKNQGQKIDPKTARSILQNVVIGDNNTPLVQQNEKGQWSWNYPITSGFGSRSAPTAGASTFHSGIDIGLGTGTKIGYKGKGSFVPGDGMGTLSVTDAQGRPYNVQVLHLDPSKKMDSSMNDTMTTQPIMDPNAPLSPGPYSEVERERDIYQAYAQGFLDSRGGKRKIEKTTRESLMDNLKRQLIQQAINPFAGDDFLSSYVNSSPAMYQQSPDIFY